MNTAQVIPFKKPLQSKQGAGGNMYSDRFVQGYVMSSRLYRNEVWPFLTDAARNVYIELESRIIGHNKESDFVSWSQLQGGKHKGSRKMSLSTVKVGLAMLLANNIASVVATGKQGVKKYQLHEVSLVNKKVIKPTEKESSKYFGNSSTSETEAFRKQKQNTSETEVPTTSETEHTIDSSIDTLDNNEITREKFEPQNRSMMSFIEYHPRDLKSYSLKELTQTYSAQSDFQSQAKVSFPDFTDEQILSQLKKLAQWSLSAETRSPQKWMTCWLNWLSNFQNSSQTKPANNKPPAPQKPKHHRYGSGAVSGDNS